MVETGKDFEFFKVFLPQFSSHELVIPPAFIDILEKPLPKEASLLDQTGRLWYVKTETKDTEERVCVLFRKGWEIFAKDQSLEFGDFLVFRYDGVSRFSVKIFAQDGCKKDLCRDKTRVSVEKEPIREGTKDRGTRFKRNPYSDSANKKPNVVVLDEPEYVSSIKTEPEYRESTRRKVNRSGDLYDIPWVSEKRHKGFADPDYKPKNPHFVRTINNHSFHRLEIPPSLLKSNGIDLEEDIELCDENGNKWPSKIVKDHKGIRLSCDSWTCFGKKINLMKSSKCLFEFIVRSNGKCNEIQVRQFEETLVTTLTRSRYQVIAV